MTGGSGLGVLESRFLDQEEPILHPSNAVFWEWEKLPLTVRPTLVSTTTTSCRVVSRGVALLMTVVCVLL